ncbi:MAG: ABC transporter permease, partial [Bacteroidales bacterium]|nr:ABC transporter permease [Bacteroidales bacterium]
MIWSISWKNVWRNKIRSLIVIVAFTLGIFGGVYMVAVFIGMIDSRVKMAIGNEASHIQVHHPTYLDNNEPKYTIDDYQKYASQIEKLPEVKGVSPRIKILGMASTSGNASGVMINGVDVDRERQVTGIAESLVEGGGSFFEEDGRNPIVIGEKLAKTLKLTYYKITDEDLDRLSENKKMRTVLPLLDSLRDKQFRKEADFEKALASLLGESDAGKFEFHIKAAAIKYRLKRRIVLSFQSLDGHIAYDAFRVVGIYKTGNSAFDGLNLFVRMPDIAPVASMQSNQVNQMAILLSSVEYDDQVAEQVMEIMPGMDVQTWDEIMPEAGMYASAMDFYLFIFMVIILLALGFGIVNTMLMAVLERVKELGMLMAIGMNKKRIFNMIMLETIFLGMTGAVIGMAISYGLIWYTGRTGLDLTSLYQEGF